MSGFRHIKGSKYRLDLILDSDFNWIDFPKEIGLNLMDSRAILYREDYKTDFSKIRIVKYERDLLSKNYYIGIEGTSDEIFFLQRYNRYGVSLTLDVSFPKSDDLTLITVEDKFDLVNKIAYETPEIISIVEKGYDFKEKRGLTKDECFDLSNKMIYEEEWQPKLLNLFLSGIRLDGGRLDSV